MINANEFPLTRGADARHPLPSGRGDIISTARRTASDYLPALDGLRAVSILLVFAAHAGFGDIVPGGLGVVVFFVISGFLLTGQMVTEIDSSGTLNLKNFYLRRFFRLAPALLLYLAGFGALLAFIGWRVTAGQILSGIFYLANYYRIFIGYPPDSPLPIAWSLAVEEHYYIVFPLCLLAFRRRLRAILPFLAAALALVLAWRVVLFQTCGADPAWTACGRAGELRTDGTDAIFDCILYGAVTAILLHYYRETVSRFFINRAAFLLSLAGLVLSLAIRNPEFRATARFSLQSFCIAIAMVNILFGRQRTIRRLLSLPPALLIGRLSYSLYLFHYGVLVTIVAVAGEREHWHTPEFIAYFVLSFALAAASYYLVEKPMVRIRRRFGSHRSQVTA